MVQINFDANQVAPNTGFQPVPEGWYNVAIDSSEIKPTKDKAGAFLELKCLIIDGEHTGKPVFIRLNVQNQNQQAVDIAYGELSAICHVIGVYQVADTSQMHGIPFQIKVVVRPAKGGYDESNDVKAYRDAAGNEPGKAPTQGGAPTQFGGNAAPQQTGQAPAFGGQPQQQGQGAATGAPQGQVDPNQQGFETGPATQQAQQPPAQQGNDGWTQQAQTGPNQNQQGGGAPVQGSAPWGAQQ
jgi:hypothetical protein